MYNRFPDVRVECDIRLESAASFSRMDGMLSQARENALSQPSSEQALLLAEYALDFAMQAASRALLISLEAIDAQMTEQEEARNAQ